MNKISRFLTLTGFFVIAVLSADNAHAASWTSAGTTPITNSCAVSVVYQNKLWIIGGTGGLKTVLSSTDGVNWSTVTTNAAFPNRRSHGAVVFNDKMYVLGGYDNISTYYNDVWYSTDGSSWTQATSGAGWSARMGFGCVVFNNKIWVIGGYYPSAGKQDVWYSSDGASWTQATSSAAFGARATMAAMVFNNKMYVACGWNGSAGYYYDVWYSTDGATWTQSASSVGYNGGPGAWGVHDNKMWLVCWVTGTPNWCYPYSIVTIYSSDGVSWYGGPNFPYYYNFQSSAVFKNNLYVMNGLGNGCSTYNIVYYLTSDIWNP